MTALKTQSSLLATLLMCLGSFGPSIAAVIVVAYGSGRAGLRVWFGRCLQWRVGAGWMALAFSCPLP